MNKHISRTMFRLCRRQPPRSRNPVTFFLLFFDLLLRVKLKAVEAKKTWNNYCAPSSVAKGAGRENRLLLVTFLLNLSYLRTILSLGGGGGRGLCTQENWTCFIITFFAPKSAMLLFPVCRSISVCTNGWRTENPAVIHVINFIVSLLCTDTQKK